VRSLRSLYFLRPQLMLIVIQQQTDMLTQADLEAIHTFASQHRELLSLSKHAGCFHCCATFAPREIVEWIDAPRDATGGSPERVTALCPRCGVAAVLPSASYYPLTDTLLAEMRHHFFER
jgi:hypothetical protein